MKDLPRENRTVPSNKNPTRISLRGGVSKLIKFLWSKSPDVGMFKLFSFGFLYTVNNTITLIQLLSDGITFVFGVDSSNVPIKDVPTFSFMCIYHGHLLKASSYCNSKGKQLHDVCYCLKSDNRDHIA
jgi:hypothetical protein